MGGSAFSISGKLSRPASEYMAAHDLNGRLGNEIPVGRLSGLADDLKKYLKETIPKPHSSSKKIFDYLGIRFHTYLRRERKGKNPSSKWKIEIVFSGCAGEAEISASLAAHWAGHWYAHNSERLRTLFFEPFGFIPSKAQGFPTPTERFMPIENLGYAKYESASKKGASAETCLGLEASMTEQWESGERTAVLRRLAMTAAPLLRKGPCRCQLCSPDFQPIPFTEEIRRKGNEQLVSWMTGILRFVFLRSRLWAGFSLSVAIIYASFYLKPEHLFMAIVGWMLGASLFAACLLLSILFSGAEKADKRQKGG